MIYRSLINTGFHTSVAGTSVFSPRPNAFIGHTPALMIRRLAKPAAGSFTAIRLFCEIRHVCKHLPVDIRPPSTLRQRNLKTEFSLKTHQMFSVHTTRRRNLKTQQSLVIFHLCLRKSQSRKSYDYYDFMAFLRKAPFSKCFPSTQSLKRKAGVFKFLRFKERFRKAPFSWRISVVDGRSNRRHKAAFSNFSDVQWTRPHSKITPSKTSDHK